jgi:FkbM family methyltransferase
MRTAYVGSERSWVRTTWGGKLLVDTSDLLLAPWLLLDGEWEPEMTAFIREQLRPNGTFVDVGANLGYYSILAGFGVGWSGRVYSFEPNPRLFDLLVRNVSANWMKSFVTPEPLAVYEDARTTDFFVSRHFAGNSTLASLDVVETELDTISKISVQTVSLDEYFADYRDPIDVIKIDIEGAELFAFRGMRELLKRNPNVAVVCEWSQNQMKAQDSDPAELLEEFRRHDFKIYRIEPVFRPVEPADSLLDVEYCDIALMRPDRVVT